MSQFVPGFGPIEGITVSCSRMLLCGMLLSSLSGCRPKVPVEEVTVAASGVQVHNLDEGVPLPPWPAWRGPQGNGIAPDQPLPTTWSDADNVKWQADVPGRGHGSPTVTTDLVLLATADDGKQVQSVLAWSRSDGSLLWETKIHEGGFPGSGELHPKGTNANSTVACDGTRAYITFLNHGKVVTTALALTGKILWQREVGAFGSKFGYAPSPILYKSLVIVAADNFSGGYIAALDGATGEIAWRVARPAMSSYSSPVVANVAGKDRLLIAGCRMLACHDPASGEKLWETPCLAESTCGTVVTAGDRIFAAGGYPDRETICLDAEGRKLWSNNTKVYEPSLLATATHVYAVTDDGIAHCWSNETGQQVFRHRLGGSFSASPILCNGLIYVPNLSGETFVFKADTPAYEQVAVNRLGSDCYASPAAAAGELYLRIGQGSGRQRREQLVCICASSSATGAAE